MFYGHIMCVHLQQPEKRVRYLSSPVYCCRAGQTVKTNKVKIGADILMVFAGQFFTSFKSTGRNSDKTKDINISILSAFAANEHCVTIKHFRW